MVPRSSSALGRAVWADTEMVRWVRAVRKMESFIVMALVSWGTVNEDGRGPGRKGDCANLETGS